MRKCKHLSAIKQRKFFSLLLGLYTHLLTKLRDNITKVDWLTEQTANARKHHCRTLIHNKNYILRLNAFIIHLYEPSLSLSRTASFESKLRAFNKSSPIHSTHLTFLQHYLHLKLHLSIFKIAIGVLAVPIDINLSTINITIYTTKPYIHLSLPSQ